MRKLNHISDFPESLPDIPGDADQLTQVFQNLLENAMKWAPEKRNMAKISVDNPSSANSASAVMVSIEDQVMDPSKDLARFTERFYRVDKARSREQRHRPRARNLKHIVGRHRGRLEIDSEEGVGSTFTVFLPTFAD